MNAPHIKLWDDWKKLLSYLTIMYLVILQHNFIIQYTSILLLLKIKCISYKLQSQYIKEKKSQALIKKFSNIWCFHTFSTPTLTLNHLPQWNFNNIKCIKFIFSEPMLYFIEASKLYYIHCSSEHELSYCSVWKFLI